MANSQITTLTLHSLYLSLFNTCDSKAGELAFKSSYLYLINIYIRKLNHLAEREEKTK